MSQARSSAAARLTHIRALTGFGNPFTDEVYLNWQSSEVSKKAQNAVVGFKPVFLISESNARMAAVNLSCWAQHTVSSQIEHHSQLRLPHSLAPFT